MRSSFALSLAATCLIFGQAHAQAIRQPSMFRNVAHSDYYTPNDTAANDTYYAPPEASPSDLRVAANVGAPAAQANGKAACDHGLKGDSCSACAHEPWRLFPEIGCGWNLTGWVAVGATANADNPDSNFNGPVTFNDREEFQANQIYLTFGRDVDTGGCGFDWGGRVDFMFGSDYFFTQAVGLELHDDGRRHWNRSSDLYGIALPQAYVELGYNNLRLKLGHFYTIIGNEVVTAPDNFFYSHAYTMQYGEPFTHTGGLLSWDLGERLTVHGGLVNGWDKFDAESDRTSFLGGFNYTPCHERYSLAVAFIVGEEDGTTPPIAGTRTMYSVVFNYNISDNLQYVFQHDNGWQETAPGVDEEWYGINQYLLYTINDCWKLGARAEWFRDDDGTRLSGIPVRVGNPLNADFSGNYYNFSLGLNWTPSPNLTVRPEARWDWSDSTAVAPYDDFTKDSQFLGAFDLIYHF